MNNTNYGRTAKHSEYDNAKKCQIAHDNTRNMLGKMSFKYDVYILFANSVIHLLYPFHSSHRHAQLFFNRLQMELKFRRSRTVRPRYFNTVPYLTACDSQRTEGVRVCNRKPFMSIIMGLSTETATPKLHSQSAAICISSALFSSSCRLEFPSTNSSGSSAYALNLHLASSSCSKTYIMRFQM